MDAQKINLGPNSIHFTIQGSGPALLMLHGWPFNSGSFRHVVGPLSEHFTCILPDSLGLGESVWDEDADFSFTSHRDMYREFATRMRLESYAIFAHDTGATIGRYLAAVDSRVTRLVLLDTEIPGHRPPFLPMFQKALRVPGAAAMFRELLKMPTFVRSDLGFGGCFSNPAMLDEGFFERYVHPIVRDRERLEGVIRYLDGIAWSDVDALEQIHEQIQIPTLLVWGRDDNIFPVSNAELVARQLNSPLNIIEGAGFLAHEEKPADVLELAIPFLTA